MYIREINIQNIRSIESFQMNFEEGKEAGWHVLIGDNGTGKSTIVRAIALGLIGVKEIPALRLDYNDLLRFQQDTGSVQLTISRQEKYDKASSLRQRNLQERLDRSQPLLNKIFNEEEQSLFPVGTLIGKILISKENRAFEDDSPMRDSNPNNYFWGTGYGWFSCSFGPFRRLTGGDRNWNNVYRSSPKAGSHLSVFGEGIALTEALEWLKELDYKRKDKDKDDKIIKHLTSFINKSGLLPHGVNFSDINSDGIFFKDSQNNDVQVLNLSDGFRSILSLAFELIRQLYYAYGSKKVFSNIEEKIPAIDLPGVVLIDEVDAHLHPTWQTRIGEWFTTYFPNIQFIVTTHSPLICRACNKGTIWRLPAPNEDRNVEEVTGTDKDKLVFGNVLDAYGTGVFGENVTRSESSAILLEELSKLNYLHMLGKLTDSKDLEKMEKLRSIFSTDDTLEF